MSNATVSTARPMSRSATDRKLLGVCAGFAEFYGMDPLVVRIIVAVLAFFGGLGIVLYLAGAALLPEPGDTSDILSGRRLTMAIIAGIAALIILPSLVFPFGDGAGVIATIAIVALLILLARRPAPSTPTAGGPPQPTTFDAASPPPDVAVPAAQAADPQSPAAEASFTQPLGDLQAYGATPYPPPIPTLEPSPPAYPSPPAQPRPRSYLGAITMCASIIWFGLAWSLNAADLASMSAVTIFGISLAILGAGLLVGAWIGRARWLVVFALPLSLVVWGLAAVPDAVHLGEALDWVDEGIGTTDFLPTAENPDQFAWGYGSATLDLADFSSFSTVGTVHADIGIGELVIVVPEGWRVVVDAEVGIGAISLDDVPVAEGTDLHRILTIDTSVDGSDALEMRVAASADLGPIRVETPAANADPLPAVPVDPLPLLPVPVPEDINPPAAQ